MLDKLKENPVVQKIMNWAEQQDNVRVLILYSSRTYPGARVDLLSDYDLLLIVRDIQPYFTDKSYLDELGKVLVVYKNPIGQENGFDSFGDTTLYEDGIKIDYGFLPVAWLEWVRSQGHLPDELENGYVVLLDKDGLTSGLKAPTYKAYIPEKPSAEEYQALVEEFFNETTYVAKNLWRDELFFWKFNLDYYMKNVLLLRMMEWRMEIDNNWSVKAGAHGRGIKKHFDLATWKELEATYAGAGIAENWQALFKTIDLFRKLSLEVGERMGFTYPRDLDSRVVEYLHKIHALAPGATTMKGLAVPPAGTKAISEKR